MGPDDRGFGTQIDFLSASTIYLSAWVLFLVMSMSVVGGLAPPDTADKVSAERGADRLADDLLATGASEPSWDRTCTEAFFAESAPGSCGFDSAWGSGHRSYLEDALSIHDVNIHVAIRDTSGSIQSIGGTDLEAGNDLPSGSGDVYGWDRHGALDYDSDGTDDWVVVEVRVWS